MSETPPTSSGPGPIRIATRGSALALAQSRHIQARCLELYPDRSVTLDIIRTTGDQWQSASLAAGHLPKGLFTKELETALLEGQADLAVHSLKDLPTSLPEGLILGAVGRRVDARDVLVVRADVAAELPCDASPVMAHRGWLPEKAVLATNSTRRAAQVRSIRPDIQVVPIRGNVGTRLRKLSETAEWRATLLAAAGLQRLEYRILENGRLDGPEVPDGLRAIPVSIEEMIPCVGQAALGLEIRDGDASMLEVCRALNHPESEACVLAERAFLQSMGGGCQTAVAGHATLQDGQVHLEVVSFMTGRPVRARGAAAIKDAVTLGRQLAGEV